MNRIVLHSNDPYLLMQMFTDLMMSGKYKNDDGWNDYWNPFNEDCFYLRLGTNDVLVFHNHDCYITPIELTEDNYISTLTKILS